ncbi:MAG: hypothetical protein J7J20_01395 [Desulfurococcales archaeon]|nr:hypothetical protein [Desulfurococcales archaeon]
MVLEETFKLSIELHPDLTAKVLSKLNHLRIWPFCTTRIHEDVAEVTLKFGDKDLRLKVKVSASKVGERRIIRYEGEGIARLLVEYVVYPSDSKSIVEGRVLLISDPVLEDAVAPALKNFVKELFSSISRDLSKVKAETTIPPTASAVLKHIMSEEPIFVGQGKQRVNIMRFFERDLGFELVKSPELEEGYKVVYGHPRGRYTAEVHFGRISLKDHHIEFGRGRFKHDYPTAPLAELLLERLQYHIPSYEVLIDTLMLLLAHDVCEKDKEECINGKQIAKHLTDDWKYWNDVTTNLNKIKELAEQLLSEKLLSKDQHDRIVERVNKLLKIIEKTSKSRHWVRGLLGFSMGERKE